MSYLLSGKVQTCYSNNVFCKIKIFEYLETGRYEDYRPRPGLKFLSPKNRNFRWIDLFSDHSSNYRKISIFGVSVGYLTTCQMTEKLNFRQLIIFKPNKANEAADNARYLRSLEPACKPLYAYDPLSMIEHIPNLIKVISNIYQGLCFDSRSNVTPIRFLSKIPI